MVALRRAIRRVMAPLERRVMLMVGRAVLTAIDDGPRLQVVQMRALAGETVDEAERFQDYGFTSVPLEGAEAVLVCPGGIRQHPLAIAVDDRRYRPKGLRPGEACAYTRENTDATPHHVLLKKGRGIDLRAGPVSIVMDPVAGLTLRGARSTVRIP